MSERQSKLEAGEIQFHQWCAPPLEPAQYKIEVTQSVDQLRTNPESSQQFTQNCEFHVAGPRFTLDPSEIYSVYPPKGAIGDFANALPHVVFTRRTLPWERSVVPGPRAPGETCPWMALLVFSAADFDDGAFPKVTSRKVSELLDPKDDACGPGLTGSLALYEDGNDLCSTIDLPWNKFQLVAPSTKDLAYLAHVREVNTGDKETLSFLADGWFSVVLANRFPESRQPFSAEDFTLVPDLVTILQKEDSPRATCLRGEFDDTFKKALTAGSVDKPELVQAFNRLVRRDELAGLRSEMKGRPSEEERKLLDDKALQGSDVVRLNRLLLECVFPEYIAKRPDSGGDGPDAANQPLAVENKAFLVSLEGVTDYLPGNVLAGKTNIRLAVLASWSFHCEEAFTFKASMEKLDVKLLCVPWKEPKEPPKPAHATASEQVRHAFEMGYTALNHNTRLGEQAVSWYRGPLVPLDLEIEDSYAFRPAPDAAVRYSPLDGMMDVTYAAAFQLGRLLALQDRHFARALHTYRSGVNRQINRVMREEALRAELGNPKGETESDIMTAFLGGRSNPNGSGQRASTSKGGDDPAFDARGQPTQKIELSIPETVTRWLGRLMLLYRVPFRYLVPDELMLPPDSIRFFHLDPGWLNHLLAGACSVGRSSAREQRIDRYLSSKFLGFALEESLKVRTRALPETDAADDTHNISADLRKPMWPLTGFLIRSPVVEGWQGLEMRAWKDSRETELLAPLRIDRLARDIMLCIFNGRVNRIEIKQPPEGMHFGAAPDGDGYTRLRLRSLVNGSQLDPPSTARVPLRQDGARVVAVAELATTIAQTLHHEHAFTSAEFGVQMVESPGRVVFDVTTKEEVP